MMVPNFSADLGKGIKGLKVGHVRHFYDGDLQAHPEMSKAVDEAAGILSQLGADVREIHLPSLPDFTACNRIILGSEAYAIHRRWLQQRPGDYAQLTRQRLLNGAGISAADYIDALRWRRRLIAETEAVMEGLDCMITASSLDPAARLDDPETLERSYPRQCRQPFNITGQPALAVPAGFSSNGLPLSIQLIGHAWQEARVYQVAAAYEQVTNWTSQHPPALA
jgi:aspartyl-tRNA(Asn)/glutamyl-tRNA(Gln) amidotransferase subunit A